jgi:flagellin
MSSSINTNISALAAQGSLRKTGIEQATAMERLSTGVRINNAKDDAAGLAISTRMTANIRGISAAIRNANDGISLTQTAEGSLNAIQDNLQRIRELAVQSSNSTNNSSDRQALNAESQQLVAEIDRVANNTTFNGIKLIDGSYKSQSLQVGAGNDDNDRINISIGSAKSAALGVNSPSIAGVAITSGTALTVGGLTVNGVNIGASTTDGVSTSDSTGSAIAKANAINAVSSVTGVVAEVGATTATFTATAGGTSYSLNVNGVAVTGSLSTAAVAQQQTVAISGTAAAGGGNFSFFGVTTAIAGSDAPTAIGDKLVANKAAILAGAAAKAAGITDITTAGAVITLTRTAGAAGAPGAGSQTLLASVTAANSGNIGTNFVQGTITRAGVAGSTAGVAGNAAEIAAALNAVSKQTGVTASVGASGAYTLTASDGRNIVITTPTPGTTGATAATTYGSITLKSTSTDGINLGGTQATRAVLGAGAQNVTASGAGVNSIDLSTANGAQASLTVLDKAIDTVTNSRAAMGAYQNRLTASISNLETTSMNLQASRSRILDTDYAKETTNLAKSQIITQAATAMLAQANQSAQSVLALLK